jgi:hypothetical protein
MAVTLKELREQIQADKRLAIEVIHKADHAVDSFDHAVMRSDITGQPGAVARFNQFKRDQLRGLQAVGRSPFFARIEADRTDRSGTERVKLLISKARDTGGDVYGHDWEVVSWTSPITALVLNRPVGHRVDFVRRSKVIYVVGPSANYEEVVPRVRNADLVLASGKASVADEDELLEKMDAVVGAPLAPPAPVPYEAKPTFGLSDIIVLADQPQRAAMMLPFEQTLIIEGPPGSGKTSIGIMRIACLYDQQWDELGLEKGKDAPFHDYSSMQVLVFNDEMVEYLKGLAQSIGVEKVWVETTKVFFQKVCRATKMLSGTERVDKPTTAALKGRGEVLGAYFAAFQAHAQAYWSGARGALREALFAIGPDFLVLADELDRWIGRVAQVRFVENALTGSISLADALTATVSVIREGQSPSRFCADSTGRLPEHTGTGPSRVREERLREGVKAARKLVETTVRAACDRVRITRHMFGMSEYATLLNAARQDGLRPKAVDAGDRLWRVQYSKDNPSYSEFDLAVSAWLGSRILLSSNDREIPWIGAKRERFTHLVVDEAQDLSPCHIITLASQLAPKGTMSLVGDLHQNLNPLAGLRRWEDARVRDVARSMFGVNYRQTRELGEFLKELYRGLFGEVPGWAASDKTIGALPRVGTIRSFKDLSRAVATEARRWRDQIPNATVAVLYDGKMEPKRRQRLRRELEEALSDQLTTVDAVSPASGGSALRRTDRVMIVSVKQTKGLEFDAVVFVETKPRWSKPAIEVEVRAKNGLYVAASRARAGLSLCMVNLPSCIQDAVDSGRCDRAEWPADE